VLNSLRTQNILYPSWTYQEKVMPAKGLGTPKSAARKMKPQPEISQIENPVNHTTTDEQVRQLAYLKWEAAGRPDGDGIDYWLEAEQELRKTTP
jgi:Protein of unknown function (DUF2934)